MPKRRAFLSSVTVTGAALILQAGAAAETPPSATPKAAVPSPSPTPSAQSLAAAQAMRRFDPGLTDEQIEQIARDMDDNNKAGRTLDPRKAPLQNGEAPVTTFSVGPA